MNDMQNRIKELTEHTYGTWSRQKAWKTPILIKDAKGVYMYDDKNKPYLDFSSQLMCSNLGQKKNSALRAFSMEISNPRDRTNSYKKLFRFEYLKNENTLDVRISSWFSICWDSLPWISARYIPHLSTFLQTPLASTDIIPLRGSNSRSWISSFRI